MRKGGLELARLAEINNLLARHKEDFNVEQTLQIKYERKQLEWKLQSEYANEPFMVFDWPKAFDLISRAIQEKGGARVTFGAGLSGDWYRSWGYIFSDGADYCNFVKLYSQWHKPTLVQILDSGETLAWECWRYSSQLPKGVKYQDVNKWGGWLDVKNGMDLVERVKKSRIS